LRDRLVSNESGDNQVAGIKLADIRESFFLWQGGNQFEGPNTTIRSEPGEEEDIDYDAEYFHNLKEGDYEKLIAAAETFVRGGQEESARVETLKKILAITKDVTPKKPALTNWTEVTSLDEAERLAASEKFDRSHILKYTYLKVPIGEMGAGKKYADIKPVSGGEFEYSDGASSIKAPVLVRGMYGYVSYTASSNVRPVTPPSVQQSALLDVLKSLSPPIGETDKAHVITATHPGIAETGPKGFKLKGYSDNIPWTKGTGEGEFLIAKPMAARKMLKGHQRGAAAGGEAVALQVLQGRPNARLDVVAKNVVRARDRTGAAACS
jgi:hypothetical protein